MNKETHINPSANNERSILLKGHLTDGDVFSYRKRQSPRPSSFQESDLLKGSIYNKNSSRTLFVVHRERTERTIYDGVAYSWRRYLQKIGYPMTPLQFKRASEGLHGIPAQGLNGRPITLYPENKIIERVAKMKKKRRTKAPERLNLAIFASAYDLGDIYGMSPRRVNQILGEELTTTVWKNKKYYTRREADPILTEHLSKKRTDDGAYFREGRQCVPLWYFNVNYGLHYDALSKYLEGVGRPKEQAGIRLVFLDEALEKLSPYIDAPEVDKKTGIYTSEEGKQFAPVTVAARILHMSVDKLLPYLEGTEYLAVKTRAGFFTPSYNLEEVTVKAKDYLARPHVDDLEKAAETYVSQKFLADEYNIPYTAVRKILQPIVIKVRGKGGNIRYPESQARARLEAVLAKPEVDKETNNYVDENGDVYVLLKQACDRLGVSTHFLKRIIAVTEVPMLEGRKDTRELDLYLLSALQAGKDAPPPPKKPVRKKTEARDRRPELEQEARELISRGISLTRPSLRANKQTGFDKRVWEYYPGGMQALRQSIGVDTPAPANAPAPEKKISKQLDKIPWDTMSDRERISRLEQYAQSLVEEGVRLTSTELHQKHSRFLRAVRKYHPEGLSGIQKLARPDQKAKEQRNWHNVEDKPATIRAEVEKITGGRDFSIDELPPWLVSAIYLHYPGKNRQLREDLGLSARKRPERGR